MDLQALMYVHSDLAWLVTVRLVMRGHALSRNTHTALVTMV